MLKAGKHAAYLGQEEGADKDTSFQGVLETESCIVALEGYRWRFRHDSSRGAGRNISDSREDRRRREIERTGACQVDRNPLEQLDQHSLGDRWPLQQGTRKVTGAAER